MVVQHICIYFPDVWKLMAHPVQWLNSKLHKDRLLANLQKVYKSNKTSDCSLKCYIFVFIK